MSAMAAVGIDLGTTYSSIAIVNDNGQPEIIPNAETERLTPSAVYFDDDTIVVGQIAKDALSTDPDHAVLFVKRQMGSGSWHFPFKGQRHSAVDISALILKKLKQDAENYLARPLRHAVITVPAYFDDDRRRATIAAGELAGFNVLDLVNEPTAAAVAFGVERSKGAETVLVYDLGGGTFDVTIMRVDGDQIQIVASDGDHQLGGKDFDDALIRHAVAQFVDEHGFDPTEDAFVAGDVRAQAEKAKRELSQRSKTMLAVRAGGKMSRVRLDRETMGQLIKPRLDTTLTIIRAVLSEAKMRPGQIDRVLLIGGSTRLPAVRDSLQAFFGREPDASVNPDEAVALGAALLAARKLLELDPTELAPPVVEKVGGLQITDVTSHSIGIEAFVPGTQQRINSILIPRNSPIPTEVSKEYVTTLPGQTAIRVSVFQGEFEDPALCNPIGDFTLGGLPAGRPPGQKVRVTLSCGTNGVIHVAAVDITTGLEMRTEVTYKKPIHTPAERSAKQRWLDEADLV